MEILDKFGFEPILFIAQIVNFLIIFFVLKKFLYKPLLKIIDERKKKIEEGLTAAEENNKKLTETIEKEQEILKKAQIEARKLIDEAKSKQDEIINKSEQTAKLRVEKMLADAKTQINSEVSIVEKRLASDVSRMASIMLNESLKDFFTPSDQELILKNAIKKLKKRADD